MLLDTEKEPEFSQPFRQIISMIVVLAAVSIIGFVLYPFVAPVFLASPYLNGLILAVFLIGVCACFWQVLQLISSVSWIEGFALDRPGHEFVSAPRLLASLAALLKGTKARLGLTSGSAGSILDSVAMRLEEARDITRYIINLLIFLGLLGTFYGLATTVPAVVDTIRSLAPQDGEQGIAVFDRLIVGLEAQLGGMGTAFASSLLGLAGSLVVGLLELFAGHGQNRFYMELEEWLSSITRIGVASDGGEAGAPMVAGLLDQTALQVAALREVIEQAEERRTQTDARLSRLTEALAGLTTRLGESEAQLALLQEVRRMADTQAQLSAILTTREEEAGMLDAEARARLRNIDTHLLRVLEELAQGRDETLDVLRRELAALRGG